MTPDPRNQPGPTTDERIQIWSVHHFVAGLLALAVIGVVLVIWFFHA